MAPRPSWRGYLRLSLVTCPVASCARATLGVSMSRGPEAGDRAGGICLRGKRQRIFLQSPRNRGEPARQPDRMSAGILNTDHEQVSSATVQAGEPMIVKEIGGWSARAHRLHFAVAFVP